MYIMNVPIASFPVSYVAVFTTNVEIYESSYFTDELKPYQKFIMA